MTVGSRIKTRRQELNMSVDELAKRLDKNRATIYRYEKGDIENLPIDILDPLAKALDTTPQYLMGWDDHYASQKEVTIGDVLKALRLNNNLTVEEFSKEIGVPIKEIENYESGKGQIPVSIINTVVDFFGVSISDIINTNIKSDKIAVNKQRVKHFKLWHEEFGDVNFTDEEVKKVIDYAKFVINQRDR